MLHSINVALSAWTIANVVVSEAGVQGLTIRSVQFGVDGTAIELDKAGVAKLLAILKETERQASKGMILTIDLLMLGVTPDELTKKVAGTYQLPY